MDWRSLATSERGEALERAVYASRKLDMDVVGIPGSMDWN